MNCTQAEELTSSFIDGEIAAVDEGALFTHLSECDSCRAFLQRTVGLRSSLASAPKLIVPVSLDRRIHRFSIHPTAIQTFTMRFWRRRYSVPSPVFAMLMIILILSITLSATSLFRTGTGPQPEQTQVVYIMNLEPIEVQGNIAQDHNQ